MRTEIIPAILPKDFAELKDKLELIHGLAKTVQIDICDGQFVPNATWPYKKHDDSFEKLLREEEGLPGWETTNFEFDLMVNKVDEIAEDWVRIGAHRIILHVEGTGDLAKAIEILTDKVEIGLALSMDTPIDVIEPYKDQIQSVQLMGIYQIGFQGQPFDTRVIEKIKKVKAAYPNLAISIDGAVSMETAPLLIEAGASRLVVGSAIFNSDNVIEAVQKFKRL